MREEIDSRRTHVVMPETLLAEIDELVGARGRSQFLVEAASYEVRRRRQLAALEGALGAWSETDHPELSDGAVAYQNRLRAESDHRIQRADAHHA
ncbi:MAG: hypothetical protein R2729_25915 [Bryobacteraceae bacterium]